MADDDRLDPVFRALADPARRALLDALRARDGRTLGELCDVLPSMTRFGVMKHLAVLAEAHLVIAERHGRTKVHHLNPVPIREIHDRWISNYAEPWVAGLTDLRRRSEGA
jgi:DNA-binding transcriptional ArsR family regulator